MAQFCFNVHNNNVHNNNVYNKKVNGFNEI